MDDINPWRFIFAFVFVIGLIGLMGLAMKRYGRRQRIFGAQGEGGRLDIIEVRYLDARRRLVLVRRDQAEHLLLLSDKGELVVESGIKVMNDENRLI